VTAPDCPSGDAELAPAALADRLPDAAAVAVPPPPSERSARQPSSATSTAHAA
jgi:hypothetical protein